ncbi:hypothetical protein G5B30_14585 [Sphingobacterium sp. SGG-5]|uniref:hypothetical protein n=1 Tax=Sphingobacterium sp. SGG-5 TaxID=2710881 RepID=UPI0013EC206C|nr:hypothetical protein [Sphingobacterium sp. SGG-5]NGM63134.1 hypothetical protein [Sphingobacterium sp. SGG-5]
MKTVLLEVNSREAYRLLKNLEELKLVRILKNLNKTEETKYSIYDFVGVLSKEEAVEMQNAITESCEVIDEDDWK